MERRAKVELFDQLRRAYEFEGKSIRALAKEFRTHRRIVRQALENAIPPERKRPARKCPVLDQVRDFIDEILIADQKEPRKQRHTAQRIFVRIGESYPGIGISDRRVREYVQLRKQALGLGRREVCVPQSYEYGVEGQVDWYEAVVEIAGERQTVQIFGMRGMASGAAFHRAYERATQQAFLEAHQRAFHYFGGVFRRLRYDNLTSAVKRILRGYRREENERFLLFRSHWQYEASFCNPGEGHEKGGVEGEVGYFRRNHLVPVPVVNSLAQLNERLLAGCQSDLNRVIAGREHNIEQAFRIECGHLLPLQLEDFELAEESFCRVDGKGCVQAKTNFYSTPLRPGVQARVKVLPMEVEIWFDGRKVASHQRCYRRRQQILNLEHYLDVLERKPGALAGSTALEQWRAAGRWTTEFDRFWSHLQQRHGAQAGTRLMIELLQLGRQRGYDRLAQAIKQALNSGANDAAAVRYLMTADESAIVPIPLLSPEEVRRAEYYARPLPTLGVYDQLLDPVVREVWQ